MNKFVITMLTLLVVAGCASTEVVTPSMASQLADPRTISIINKTAIANNIPVDFAHSVVFTESRYKPNAYNAGSYGLGQIKCSTAKGIGFTGSCNKLYDPETNLTFSFKYLRMALDRSNDDLCHAASLYQAGIDSRVKKSHYCKLVLSNKIKLQ